MTSKETETKPALVSRRGFLRGVSILGALAATSPKRAARVILEVNSQSRQLPEIDFPELSINPSDFQHPKPGLTHDVQVDRLGYPPLSSQENPPLTEEQIDEIKKAHRQLKNYCQLHPEIPEQIQNLQDRLKTLGFNDDPTPNGTLQEATWVDMLSNIPVEEVIELCNQGIISFESVLYLVDTSTGESKKRLLEEKKEPEYWTPYDSNEKAVLAMAKESHDLLFDKKAGHYINKVSFASVPEARAKKTEEKEEIEGIATGQKEIIILLADDFQEIDELVVQRLREINERLELVLTNLKEVDSELWSQLDFNLNLREYLTTNIIAANEATVVLIKVITSASSDKVSSASEVLRHEVSHLLDPLRSMSRDVYSLDDRLFALAEIVNYLTSHPELVKLPAGLTEIDPATIWDQGLDLSHVTWADHFTKATSPFKEDQESVDKEAVGMIDRILARTGLDLNLEKVKQIYWKAANYAYLNMLREYQETNAYNDTRFSYWDIESFYSQIGSPSKRFINLLPDLIPFPNLVISPPDQSLTTPSATVYPTPTVFRTPTPSRKSEPVSTPEPTSTPKTLSPLPSPTSLPQKSPFKEILGGSCDYLVTAAGMVGLIIILEGIWGKRHQDK